MSNLSEVEKLILEFSTDEEKENFGNQKILELLVKFDKLYNKVESTFVDRDEEYGEAFELLIKETDKKVKSYLTSLEKETDKKVDILQDTILMLEGRLSDSESGLKDVIKVQIKEAKQEIKELTDESTVKQKGVMRDILDTISDSVKSGKKSDSRFKEISKAMDDYRLEFNQRLAQNRGGSMNRQMLVGGVDPLTRYTDLNFIAGTNVTITTANDDVKRRVNLTIIASGGGAGTNFETPIGTVDDSNLTFTVSNTPKYIIINGAQYLVGTGLFASYSVPTITLTSAVGSGGFIRSAY